MICVVAGHSDMTDDFKNLWIFKWVYSFHMPVFFFISGFLFRYTNPQYKFKKTSYLKFISKKSKRLLIPYLFINSITFILKATLFTDKSILQNPVFLTWSSYVDNTFFHPIGFMWFLPALYMIFVMIYPLSKLIDNVQAKYFLANWLIILFIFIFLNKSIPHINFMQISKAIYFTPYFIIGIIYAEKKHLMDKFFNKYKIVILPLSIILSCSLIFKSYFAALCGIILCLEIGLITKNRCSDSIIALSELCYSVFLLSYFPQMFVRGVVYRSFPTVDQYIFSGVSFVLGVGVPLLFGFIIANLKSKNKFIQASSFLIGI